MAPQGDDQSNALPLNDPRWRPIEQLHALLCEQTGHRDLAAQDLRILLATQIRSMRRRIHPSDDEPERVRLEFSFWDDYRLECFYDRLLVCSGSTLDVYGGTPYGFVFYGWGPDFEEAQRIKEQIEPAASETSDRAESNPGPEEEEAQPGNEPSAEAPRRGGPQFNRVVRALRELYPPDGKTPASKSYKLLQGEVADHLRPESRRLGMADPSEDVVAAAIKQLGRTAN